MAGSLTCTAGEGGCDNPDWRISGNDAVATGWMALPKKGVRLR